MDSSGHAFPLFVSFMACLPVARARAAFRLNRKTPVVFVASPCEVTEVLFFFLRDLLPPLCVLSHPPTTPPRTSASSFVLGVRGTTQWLRAFFTKATPFLFPCLIRSSFLFCLKVQPQDGFLLKDIMAFLFFLASNQLNSREPSDPRLAITLPFCESPRFCSVVQEVNIFRTRLWLSVNDPLRPPARELSWVFRVDLFLTVLFTLPFPFSLRPK